MAEDKQKLTHVVIDGVTYEAPTPVLKLLLDVSEDRDNLHEQLRFIYAPEPISRMIC